MRHFFAAATLSIAATAMAQAQEAAPLTEAERTLFRAEVRAYLLENPEVLMEAIAVLEQRQAELEVARDAELVRVNANALFNDGYSWVGGNPDGDITLVEFIDYRCGYCRRAHPEVTELIETDGNIRIILKEYPILGEQSVLASRFAIATKTIAGDEAYKNIADTLIALQSDVSDASLRALAASYGLDADAIFAEMNSEATANILQTNRALGDRMQISGTPTFVIEDQMLRGYVPLPQMQQIVAGLRQASE